MYTISRSKAAQIVATTLTELTGVSWNYSLPGMHLDERRIYPVSDPTRHNVWKIESDSSIQARNAWERTELVSPVLTWEQMPLLQQIIRNLRAAGARSDPAHQCGVHVHVDGAGHTARSLLNLTNIMASHEQLLIGSIGIAPARMHWCQTVDQRFLRAVNARVPQSLRELEEVWYAAQTGHAVAAPGQNLVRVRLVTNVPDQQIVRRIEYVVQRDRQFDGPEIRRKVSSSLGD